MSTNSSNVAAVQKLIEDDRRLTVTQISQELQISYGSVQSIIKNELQYRKITARWVPKLLSDEQKNACVQIYETLLARCKNEGDTFLHHIVTVDETWCHHYTPELKRASKEWQGRDEECPVKHSKNTTVSWQGDGDGFLGLHGGFTYRFSPRSKNHQCGLLLRPFGEGLSSLLIKKTKFPHQRRVAAS
jgi:hypothetical protein